MKTERARGIKGAQFTPPPKICGFLRQGYSCGNGIEKIDG